MACYRPAEYILQDVNYVDASGRRLPGILLYEAGGLGYVQFPTAAWGHYDGFGYYQTAAIHLEHLVAADGKPLGTRDESRRRSEGARGARPTGTPKKLQTLPPAKPTRVKADKSLRDLVRKASTEHQGLNGKEHPSPKSASSETLKKYGPSREIGGLSLADFLGRR